MKPTRKPTTKHKQVKHALEAYALLPESGHGFSLCTASGHRSPKVRRRIAASDESDGLLFAEALRQFYNGEADPGPKTTPARITLFGLFSARPSRD